MMQGVMAVALVFALLGNMAVAQDEPVRIVPRHFGSAQGTAVDSGAQQPAAAPPSAQNPPADTTVVLPPGTQLPLGLVRPLELKSSQAKGRGVYLQVTFPVTLGKQMIVPPGAYVQGTIEKLTTNRGANPDLEFELRSATLIFATGYTVPLTGDVHLLHNFARLKPGDSPVIAALPVGKSNVPQPAMSAVGTTPAPPPLPPLPSGPRTAFIAIGVVTAVAFVALTAWALHRHNDIYLDAGTPLEIILAEPLTLDAASITTATQQYSAQMATNPPQIVKPPEKMCYDPGSPGTPDTVIPGTPPSPPTVIPGINGAPDTVIPGSPGTPDTVIPGTPGTAGSYHKCPIFR